jgi:molecular chaperone Hsp33
MSDTLQRFLFENAAIRGELVHLDATWQAALERHDYPEPVRNLLGQLMVASVLLSATLKFNGSLTMQVQGNGPVNFMVVEATSRRTVRGLAHWKGEVPDSDLAVQFGDGLLAITIDPDGGERYQGVVALQGDSLADAIDGYLERSEQLDTRMWLVADSRTAAGLLLQKLPQQDRDEDDWNRIITLGATLTDAELVDVSQQEVIDRLFHEEDVRLFESEPVSFRCNCSRERVAATLRGIGREEVIDIIDKEGMVEINCEFCNRHYVFDVVDVEQLFVEAPTHELDVRQH